MKLPPFGLPLGAGQRPDGCGQRDGLPPFAPIPRQPGRRSRGHRFGGGHSDLGLPQEQVTLAYTGYNFLYALLSYPLGGLADRVGLTRVVAVGFALYAMVYLGFAWADTAFWGVALLLLYALYSAAFEGASRAYLATLIPQEAKATAIGLYHTVVGILLLPASLIFGFLWQSYGPELAFGVGAGLALLALLFFLLDGRRARP